jgi:hypothetical protein
MRKYVPLLGGGRKNLIFSMILFSAMLCLIIGVSQLEWKEKALFMAGVVVIFLAVMLPELSQIFRKIVSASEGNKARDDPAPSPEIIKELRRLFVEARRPAPSSVRIKIIQELRSRDKAGFDWALIFGDSLNGAGEIVQDLKRRIEASYTPEEIKILRQQVKIKPRKRRQ